MKKAGESRIDEFLSQLKGEGRSAPDGRYWHDFYQHITRNVSEANRPSPPLILAASIASDAEKHERLREHLVWASAHGQLDEALALLRDIPQEGWNIGDAQTWTQSFSWEDDA